MLTISKEEARNFLVHYQSLSPPRTMATDEDIVSFIHKVGCIQYDPLNMTGRNADLVLQSRCRDYSASVLERLLYEKRMLIDGWDKNMSIWALADWPCFQRHRAASWTHDENAADELQPLKEFILEQLGHREFLSSADLENTLKIDWPWGPARIGRAALESLYHCGRLIIHHRVGSRKYYGLTEKFLPRSILEQPDPNSTRESFYDWHVKRRIGSIGLLWDRGGDAWLGVRLPGPERGLAIKRLLDRQLLVGITIAGMPETFYIPHDVVHLLGKDVGPHEAAFIAPLDNLLWDRKMVERLFDFEYRWEVYTPAHSRKYGYYVLPILYGNSFIGRCEPVMDRRNHILHLKNWWWEGHVRVNDDMIAALSRCLFDFTRFLGADAVSIAPIRRTKGMKKLEAALRTCYVVSSDYLVSEMTG